MERKQTFTKSGATTFERMTPMNGERERCLDAGFNEHLGKPIDMKKLIEMVKSLAT